MTSIYSILSTLKSLEPTQEEVNTTREPVEAKGSIREGIASQLESKYQKFKKDVAEGEVCEKCDSTPCQCDAMVKEADDIRRPRHPQELDYQEGPEDDEEYRRHHGINDPDRQRERKLRATDYKTLDRLERQAINRAKQIDEEPNEGNEFSGALAKAKATGAEEFEVDGKTYKVKEALDANLLKAISKGDTKIQRDPESDRNIHKKYGYRGDREEEDDDAYDEWGNLKPGRKAKPAAPGEKRGRGRPKGTGRSIGAKGPTGKSKLLKMSEARLIDEGGDTLEHILDRFPAEVKSFEQGDELESNLYDALYDYYLSTGEMPYGTAKARTGDPYEWITDRLVADLGLKETQEIVAQEEDPMDLVELTKLAGLKESCGAMSPMSQTGDAGRPEINVSTNYNSADDNSSITVTAQGDSAVALAQLLKLSGIMGDVPVDQHAEEAVEEERDIEYANTPSEETAGIDAAVPSGNDLHKSKGANPNWQGDNAMKTSQFEDSDPVARMGRDLMKEYESIKLSSK